MTDQQPKALEKLTITTPARPKLNISSVLGVVSPAFGFVASYWKIFLFLGMGFVTYVEFEMIKSYKAKIATADLQVTALKSDLDLSNKTITDQNDAIELAKGHAADMQKELDNLGTLLQQKRTTDQKKVDDLRNTQVGPTCDDALKFMNDYLGTLKWKK